MSEINKNISSSKDNPIWISSKKLAFNPMILIDNNFNILDLNIEFSAYFDNSTSYKNLKDIFDDIHIDNIFQNEILNNSAIPFICLAKNNNFYEIKIVQINENLHILSLNLSKNESSKNESSKNALNDIHSMQLIFDTLPNPMFIKDHNLKYIFVNKAFEVFANASKEEIIGKNSIDVFKKNYNEISEEQDIELLKNGGNCTYILKIPSVTIINEHYYLHFFKAFIEIDNQKYITGIITDISELENYKQKLYDEKELFKKILDELPIALLVKEANNSKKINLINKRAIEYFDIDEQDEYGNIYQKIHNKELVKILEEMDESLSETQIKPLELNVELQTDNINIYSHISKIPIIDKSSNFNFIIDIYDDISQAISDNLQIKKLMAILEESADFIGMVEIDGTIEYLNKAMRQNVFLPNNHDNKDTLKLEMLQPEWVLNILSKDAIPKAITNGTWLGETAIFNSKKEEIPISQLIIAHKDNQNKVTHLSTVIRNISDIKSKELAYLKTIEKLQNLEKAINKHAILVVTDLKGKITFVNDKFCELNQYSREELIGKNHRIFNSNYHSKEFFKDLWDTILAGKIWNGEIKNQAKDGSLHWLDTTIVPQFDKNGNIYEFLSIRNTITKIKETEQHLKSELQKEKELNELKTNFVTTVSHEFRTPLAAIMGATKILLKKGELIERNKKHEFYNDILDSVNRMTDLLEDILFIGRKEAKKIECNPIELNFKTLLLRLIDEFKINYPSNPIKLDYQAPEIVYLDNKLISQVMSNLIANALKYSPERGIVEISVHKLEGLLYISVNDYGIGIPNKDLENLFQPFYRASNVGNIQGTGLGLSIIKSCVQMHGGEITVDSKENFGTNFLVKIPFLDSHDSIFYYEKH